MNLELKKMTIKDLEREVRRHNRLYFIDHKPEISDYEFDRLVEELKKRKPDSKVLSEVGNDLSGTFKKVTHDTEMLSLDKAYDEKVMNDWTEKFEGDVIASPKVDGCAISLKYDSGGKLFQAATRGNGLVGDEMTANARFIKDIPQKISLKNVEIRGEVYMPLSIFKKYEKEFANPRNLAAGAMKQKDPEKTGEYKLSFWAYDLIGSGKKSEAEKFGLLKENRFPVVEWRVISKDGIQSAFDGFHAKRDKFDYETDGVVFKANNVGEQERLGNTAHHPRYAIAYKFQGDSGTTTINDVEWSVSRTGVITPVGVVEPVELSGASVTRVSLHNYGLMKELGISKGAKVLMMRRGGVIPNLESVVKPGKGSFGAPKKCPSCDAATEVRDDFLYCTNPKNCLKTRIGELKHFVQTVEIDGFGDKLIEKLYETGLVTDLSMFYELKEEDLIGLERMGDTLAAKLVRNVGLRRELPLDMFLRSFGIRELGKHASKILAEECGTLKDVMNVKSEELSAIHSIGDIIAGEVVDGLKNKKPLIDKLLKQVKVLPYKKKKATGALAGKSFLFTGSMMEMERGRAQKMIEEMGGVAAGSVTKDLDYLVVGDGGGSGSKLDKAKKLAASGGRVKILSEKDFIKLVK